MTQITSLKINGIKSYTQETEINLSQLNVYVGANSVGKSTAIQSLLLLRQLIDSYEKNQSAICEAYLNTEQYGLELGSYNSILTGDNEYFEIVCNGATTKIESVEGDTLKIKTDLTDLVAKEELNILNKNFYYLSAERIGPRTYQKIDSLGIETCGIHGENSFHILDKFSEKKILDELLHSETKNNAEKNLKKQVEKWLSNFFDGVEFTSTLDTALRLTKLEVRQINHDMDYVSLNNVGFGLSYVLPIILTGLIAPENSLIIIENPEAHLHPKGQSKIGYFLAKVASTNRQVVIETHSEHVINGMRLYNLENHIQEDSFSINFFSIENKRTEVKKIPIN